MTEQDIIDRLQALGYDGPDRWGQMSREDSEGNLSRITLDDDNDTVTMAEWSASSRAWRGDGTTYTFDQFDGVLTDLEHAMEEKMKKYTRNIDGGRPLQFIVDGTINLSLEYSRANGHRLSIIDNLCAAGLSRGDAEAYAEFIIADNSKVRDNAPEECITDEQWERLEVVHDCLSSKHLSWSLGNNDYEISVVVYKDGTISDVEITDRDSDDPVAIKPTNVCDVIEVLQEIARYNKTEVNND